MTTISLELPWPPSVNRYYRNVKGKTLISADGRAYRKAVELLLSGKHEPITGRVKIRATFQVPDRRRRDLDNLGKCLFDSLTHAGVWVDDSQVDDMQFVRAEMAPGGRVFVTICEI